MAKVINQLPRELNQAQTWSLPIAGLGWVVCIVGWIFDRQDFFSGYLYAWMFFLGLSLGSMGMVMLHHLTGGKWGRPIRGIMESAMTLVPLMAILFIPILFGLNYMYEWAIPDRVAHSEILQHKQLYLNLPFFLGRVGGYFVLWTIFALFLSWASLRFQESPTVRLAAWMRKFSGIGIPLYCITLSFAVVDWVVARETNWFTTIIGFIFLCGQGLAAMSFAVVMLRIMVEADPIPEYVNSQILIDLGNLLMTLVILWSYMSFAQLLVQWSGNIRHEVEWYLQRGLTYGNGWRILGYLLITLHFFVPFVLLLFRYNKSHFKILTMIASLLLVMRVIDLYWTIEPSSVEPGRGFYFSWVTPFPLLAIGGIWFFGFIALLRRRPLVTRLEGEPEPILDNGAHPHPIG